MTLHEVNSSRYLKGALYFFTNVWENVNSSAAINDTYYLNIPRCIQDLNGEIFLSPLDSDKMESGTE